MKPLIMIYRAAIIILVGLGLALLPHTVAAESEKNKGLIVTPSRQQVKTSVGGAIKSKLRVTNHFGKTLKVNLVAKQFGVIDNTYEYTFSNQTEKWITLDSDQSVTLETGQSKDIAFIVNAPADAAPGDHNLAIFVSADMSGGGFNQTGQVASLVYVRVDDGKLTQNASIESGNVPFVAMGSRVPYEFIVKNTGNTHIAGNFYARLESLYGEPATVGSNQILLSKTTRIQKGDVPAPLLPGIYKLTYGYTSDSASLSQSRSSYVMYIPPWSIATSVLIVLVATWLIQRRKRSG